MSWGRGHGSGVASGSCTAVSGSQGAPGMLWEQLLLRMGFQPGLPYENNIGSFVEEASTELSTPTHAMKPNRTRKTEEEK